MKDARNTSRGTCPATGKQMLPDRKEARRIRAQRHWEASVYKCIDCGYFHIGRWHGVKDHDAHRAIRNERLKTLNPKEKP